MKYLILIVFLFLSLSDANALDIDAKTKFYDLLPHSKIYIDKTESLNLQDIYKIEDKFKTNDKKLLGYGYAPEFNIWIKFTLKNITNKALNRVLEYDNPLATHIEFFNPADNYVKKEGYFQVSEDRKTVNPTFKIQLLPNESKIFYIKASSNITTLIVKLSLWKSDDFFQSEIKHQFILALFFGAMIILGVYNLFIYFFTKDISYLYYVLYIFGIVFHQLIYVGLVNIYVFDQEARTYIMQLGSLVVTLPALSLALFSKTFLQIKQYRKINIILNIFIVLTITNASVFIFNEEYISLRNIMPILLLVYLIFITTYAALKKNRQAYFVLFGWVSFLTAGIFMYLSSVGIFNIFKYVPYYAEISIVSEALIFSIALADRIKQLQLDNDKVHREFILHQKHEKERLENTVLERTNDLKSTLDEKSMLLKELNHRVKNNMQTIVSLVRLQIDELDDEKVKDILTTTHNRINAMSHLHDLLYEQSDLSSVDANGYFRLLIDEIRESYSKDIQIHLEIDAKLMMEQAIYCGLILNELITNSFKYAFKSTKGNINIKLSKEAENYLLLVSDDGVGYDKKESSSLGLVLVDSLARKKLKGTIDINSSSGVEVKIRWSYKDE